MKTRLAAVLATLAAACGGSSMHSQPTLSDVQAYQALATGVASSAASYGAAAQGDADVGACTTRHADYDASVRPMVERMRTMSAGMDDMMGGSHGMMDAADLGCGADAMKAELDQHATAACAGADLAADHAEATRHAEAMGAWAAHQEVRCGELSGMMGGPGGGGTTGTCHHETNGTYTLGGMMP